MSAEESGALESRSTSLNCCHLRSAVASAA
jgi:hypothetical protein